MWRPWGNKSTVRIHNTSPSPSPSPSSPALFSCSSFKDIQSLCLDDPPQQQQPQQPQQQPPPQQQPQQPPQQQPPQQPQPQQPHHHHHHHHHQIAPSPSKKSNVFHRVRLANSLLRTWSTHHQNQPQPHQNHHQQQLQHPPPKSPSLPRSFSQPVPEHELIPEPSTESTPFIQGAEQRVVVFYTSLRVVRSTFEACKSVLSILQGFRVNLDERDVSMDSGFLTELSKVMGQPGLTLPRVFIAGRYIGGVEEISKMNEIGELKKLLEGLPKSEPGECCHVCGGYRFILCDECDGGKKVYTEKGGFRTCGKCNENGLLRCPSCLTAPNPILS